MARMLFVLGAATLLCVSASAQSIIIEAESYVASYDAGGVSIYITTCTGASGGYAVEGYDTPGDWIEVVLNMSDAGSFADSLRSAGELYEESDHQSTIFGAGPGGDDVISTYHTYGYGIG